MLAGSRSLQMLQLKANIQTALPTLHGGLVDALTLLRSALTCQEIKAALRASRYKSKASAAAGAEID